MANVAIIRCEKNETKCPLTSCISCLTEKKEGFAGYDDTRLAGIFTCRCPGDDAVNLAKILKSKGADAIHFCTCTFAKRTDRADSAARSTTLWNGSIKRPGLSASRAPPTSPRDTPRLKCGGKTGKR